MSLSVQPLLNQPKINTNNSVAKQKSFNNSLPAISFKGKGDKLVGILMQGTGYIGLWETFLKNLIPNVKEILNGNVESLAGLAISLVLILGGRALEKKE